MCYCRFIAAFGAAGLLTFITATCGLFGVSWNSRPCLGIYSLLLGVMLIMQAVLAVAFFADESWKKRLPHDDTGQAEAVCRAHTLLGNWPSHLIACLHRIVYGELVKLSPIALVTDICLPSHQSPYACDRCLVVAVRGLLLLRPAYHENQGYAVLSMK